MYCLYIKTNYKHSLNLILSSALISTWINKIKEYQSIIILKQSKYFSILKKLKYIQGAKYELSLNSNLQKNKALYF